jgi:dethiobiotin synthetase
MTIEMLKSRSIQIAALVYNMYPPEKESIANDSIRVIKDLSAKLGLKFPIFINPYVEKGIDITVDFEGIV